MRPFDVLQKKIEIAKLQNKPFDDLVIKQIKLLEDAHKEFLIQAKENNYELDNPDVCEIEVRQISAMKQLAKSINIPSDKYDKMLYDVRVKALGEDVAKQFFE